MDFFGVCGHYLLGTRFPLFFIVRSCYGRHGGGDDLKGTFFCLFFLLSLLKELWLGNIQGLGEVDVKYPHHTFFWCSFPPVLPSSGVFGWETPKSKCFVWFMTAQFVIHLLLFHAHQLCSSLSILYWLIFLRCFFGSIKWASNLKPQPYTKNELPHDSVCRDNSISAQHSWNKHPSNPKGAYFTKAPLKGVTRHEAAW